MAVVYRAGPIAGWASSQGGGTVEARNAKNTQTISWGSAPVGYPIFVTIDGVFVWSSHPNVVTGTGPGGYPDVTISVVGDGCNSVTNIDDGSDLPEEIPCPGMAVWRVSEPYLSLWLHAEPLGYQPGLGPRIAFALNFKQRETAAGLNPNIFSVGKKWNFDWLSYVTQDANLSNVVHFPGGGQRTFKGTNDYVTFSRLAGSTTNGFTLAYPDGSTNVYGFIVTNDSGVFLKAFLTERWNSIGQRTRFDYESYTAAADPVIRLKYVVDGDGRTNSISYVSANDYSTNLISQVADPFGRTVSLWYDSSGHLTNVTHVMGVFSAFVYDANDWVTNLTTPYGTTSFTITDTSGTNVIPNGRSILVTEPDGGQQLYLYKDSAPGVATSYAASEVPSPGPFTHKFDNTEHQYRNTFHWGQLQYLSLSTTNSAAFITNDFRKARMRHWLKSGFWHVGNTLSLERAPSPDFGGFGEGQKTWYDYPGRTHGAYEGTNALPLHVGQKLPDGTTNFVRTVHDGLGNVLTNISTYTTTSGAVALRTNRFRYAANGTDLLTVTNALGVQVSSNVYNAYHQVLTNYNALGEKTVCTYNSNQQLIRVQYPSGLTTTNVYFTSGDYVNWLERTIDLEIGRTNAFTYSKGLVRTFTDARGLSLTYTWDSLQRLRRVDFPDSTFVTNLYDKLDLVQTTDRLGQNSSYGFDSLRRLVAVTNVNNAVTRFGYSGCGRLASKTNAWSTDVELVTQFTYDNQGNQINATYPDATVTNWFDALGRVSLTGDGQGYRAFLYNNQGLVTNISNALGSEQAVVYDILDRPVCVTDANGVTVTNTYDNLDRLHTRTYPDGGTESFAYSARGLTAYTNQLNSVTFYAYDEAGRATFVTNANNELICYTNNPAGDLLSLTDGKNQTTRWNHDEYGRATNKLDQVGMEIRRFRFDPNGRLTNRWSKAKGDTEYVYDPLGNLTNINYPASTDVSFVFDPLNRLTTMVDAAGTTEFTYTASGQLLTEDGPWSSDTITNGYLNHMRTSLILEQPTGIWTNGFRYDSAWRLTNVTSQAGSFDYSHSYASPLPLKVSLPNTSYITNTYDVVARLAGTCLKKNDQTTLNSHEYSYDPGNRRTQQVFSAGSTYNYSYDNIGQLIFADSTTASEDRRYVYDAAWNLNFLANNTTIHTFKVDTRNQLTNATPVGNQTHDDNGNVTYNDNNFFGYGYDDENQLANWYYYDGATDGNGSPTSSADLRTQFVYDGLGRLRKKIEYQVEVEDWVAVSETRYVYDGKRVIQERNGRNTPTVSYTRGKDLSGGLEGAGGIGGLLGRSHGYSGGNWSTHNYYHSDANGNVTYLVNSSQALAASYRYDPFGNTVSLSGSLASANGYRFSSKELHASSGLYYYGHRWYQPNLQRWLNPDPVGEEGAINSFTFLNNDCVNAIGDFGLGATYLGPKDGRGRTVMVVPERAAERRVFGSEKKPAETLQELFKQITAAGKLPPGTITDSVHLDRVLGAIGQNSGYQIDKNGAERLRNVLIQR
jgi:RHS repeat-associated protein